MHSSYGALILFEGIYPREMAQQLSVFYSARVLSLVPNTHVWWFTTIYSSSPREFSSLFRTLQAPAFMCTYLYYMDTHKNISIRIK